MPNSGIIVDAAAAAAATKYQPTCEDDPDNATPFSPTSSTSPPAPQKKHSRGTSSARPSTKQRPSDNVSVDSGYSSNTAHSSADSDAVGQVAATMGDKPDDPKDAPKPPPKEPSPEKQPPPPSKPPKEKPTSNAKKSSRPEYTDRRRHSRNSFENWDQLRGAIGTAPPMNAVRPPPGHPPPPMMHMHPPPHPFAVGPQQPQYVFAYVPPRPPPRPRPRRPTISEEHRHSYYAAHTQPPHPPINIHIVEQRSASTTAQAGARAPPPPRPQTEYYQDQYHAPNYSAPAPSPANQLPYEQHHRPQLGHHQTAPLPATVPLSPADPYHQPAGLTNPPSPEVHNHYHHYYGGSTDEPLRSARRDSYVVPPMYPEEDELFSNPYSEADGYDVYNTGRAIRPSYPPSAYSRQMGPDDYAQQVAVMPSGRQKYYVTRGSSRSDPISGTAKIRQRAQESSAQDYMARHESRADPGLQRSSIAYEPQQRREQDVHFAPPATRKHGHSAQSDISAGSRGMVTVVNHEGRSLKVSVDSEIRVDRDGNFIVSDSKRLADRPYNATASRVSRGTNETRQSTNRRRESVHVSRSEDRHR